MPVGPAKEVSGNSAIEFCAAGNLSFWPNRHLATSVLGSKIYFLEMASSIWPRYEITLSMIP